MFAAAGAVGVLGGLTLQESDPYAGGGAGFRAAAGQGFGQSATQLLGRFLNRLPTVTTAPDTGCACGRPRTSSCRGLSRTRKRCTADDEEMALADCWLVVTLAVGTWTARRAQVLPVRIV